MGHHYWRIWLIRMRVMLKHSKLPDMRWEELLYNHLGDEAMLQVHATFKKFGQSFNMMVARLSDKYDKHELIAEFGQTLRKIARKCLPDQEELQESKVRCTFLSSLCNSNLAFPAKMVIHRDWDISVSDLIKILKLGTKVRRAWRTKPRYHVTCRWQFCHC